jgi:hypothetical protein
MNFTTRLAASVSILLAVFTPICPIANSAETHKIGFFSDGGYNGFGAMWLASDNGRKPPRYITSGNSSTLMKIDGKTVDFKSTSPQSNQDTSRVGARSIRRYKSDEFQLKIDLKTVKYDRTGCQILREGFLTVGNKNWSKKMKVIESFDPCG